MDRRHSWLVGGLTFALVGACVPGPGVKVAGTASGMLSGVVMAPATIISNGGAGIISNGGAGIISNAGGGLASQRYELLAIKQLPMANATLAVLDAAGQPVKGKDGKALTVVTDAQGRYQLNAALPLHNLVLAVTLPEGRGRLLAVVPKAAGAKKVDVDLVSSLTTGYILDQYVRLQDDPEKTFDRLPGAMEADTRAKTGRALDASAMGEPGALTGDEVRQTVQALRQGDAALDQQFEVVKKTLIAAGQSDLGNDQYATDVSLGRVRRLVPEDDGSLVFSVPQDRRVWRRRANGLLQVVAGSGTAGSDLLDGKRGAQANLDFIQGIGRDAEGRWLILEAAKGSQPFKYRVSRIGNDGVMQEVHRSDVPVYLIAPAEGDAVQLAVGAGEGVELAVAAPGKPLVRGTALSARDATLVKAVKEFVWDAQGRWVFKTDDPDVPDSNVLGQEPDPSVFRLDPVEATAERLVPTGGEETGRSYLNHDGGVIANDRWLKPDGTTAEAPEVRAHTERAGTSGHVVAIGRDGTVYFVNTDSVSASMMEVQIDEHRYFIYRHRDGQVTHLAGSLTPAKAQRSDGLALVSPMGVAATAPGQIVVADRGNHQIFQVQPDQKVTSLIGGTQTRFKTPTVLRADASGTVYVLEGEFGNGKTIRRIKNGTMSTVYDFRTVNDPDRDAGFGSVGHSVSDFALGTGLGIYVSAVKSDVTVPFSSPQLLWRTTGAGQPEVLARVETKASLALAVDAIGTLYVLDPQPGKGRLYTWNRTDGLTLVKESESFSAPLGALVSMAMDGQGRAYIADADRDIVYRFDPAKDAFTTIGGRGGIRFAGDGVDNSLQDPAYPAFDSQGTLYVSDTGHKQVKRIPAGDL